MAETEEALRLQIAEDLGALSYRPLEAVLYGFPWGEGELAGVLGPRTFQRETLDEIGKHLRNPETRHQPYRLGISSGHDIGKTALIAQVCWWALSTFGDTRVTVTANTGTQLATKTQPELAKWFRMALNADAFDVNVTSIKSRERPETWRLDMVPWSLQNPQASAGLHNKGKRVVIVYDEASEIPKPVWDVSEGVMLDEDTEIIWLGFGNPTKSNGEFYDVVFGRKRSRWQHRVIDSRDVEGTNKKQLAEWAQDYGEDSDFFRVRARGLPPRASTAQFIDMDLIQAAQKRQVTVFPDEPLVAGVDFAWGGSDDNVIRFRRGFDARSIPPIRIKGEFTRDPAVMAGKLADVLNRTYDIGGNKVKVAMLFFDSAGIAAPVESRLRQLGFKNIIVVNFGAHSPDSHYAYMRDYMWGMTKEWLAAGAIDADPGLEADLSGPCLVSDKQNRVKLEDKDLMKKRGIDSPDDADALALTFAMPVAPPKPEKKRDPEAYYSGEQTHGWMG